MDKLINNSEEHTEISVGELKDLSYEDFRAALQMPHEQKVSSEYMTWGAFLKIMSGIGVPADKAHIWFHDKFGVVPMSRDEILEAGGCERAIEESFLPDNKQVLEVVAKELIDNFDEKVVKLQSSLWAVHKVSGYLLDLMEAGLKLDDVMRLEDFDVVKGKTGVELKAEKTDDRLKRNAVVDDAGVDNDALQALKEVVGGKNNHLSIPFSEPGLREKLIAIPAPARSRKKPLATDSDELMPVKEMKDTLGFEYADDNPVVNGGQIMKDLPDVEDLRAAAAGKREPWDGVGRLQEGVTVARPIGSGFEDGANDIEDKFDD